VSDWDFVMKLDAGGGKILATMRGVGGRLATDDQGSIYVAGSQDGGSPMIPVTPERVPIDASVCCMQRHGPLGFPCSYQYVTKLNANLNQILYSTYVTGSWGAAPAAILVDAQRNVVLAGTTYSSDYPQLPTHSSRSTSPTLHRPSSVGTVLSRPGQRIHDETECTGTGLIYSTFLSGTEADTIAFAGIHGRRSLFVGPARISRFSGDRGVPSQCLPLALRDAPQPRRIGRYRRPYRARQRDGLRSGHRDAAGVDWRDLIGFDPAALPTP